MSGWSGGTGPESAGAITAVAALHDELRRRMYVFIRACRRPVSRDEAAAAVGISRKLAAFHLDKLVETGVLRARYEAVGGIRRVGRKPKVYEPSGTDIRISIPPRRPDLLAEILLGAVLTDSDPQRARARAVRVAADRGRDLGAAQRPGKRLRPRTAESALDAAEHTLAGLGFEPVRDTGTCVRLWNCPFHPLADQAPDLVCGINHAFVTGVLTGLGSHGVDAVLVPWTGHCCVELRTPEAGTGTAEK